jgi:hypothetical protein
MKSVLFLTLAGSAAAFAPAQQVCYFRGMDGALIDFCDLKTMESLPSCTSFQKF